MKKTTFNNIIRNVILEIEDGVRKIEEAMNISMDQSCFVNSTSLLIEEIYNDIIPDNTYMNCEDTIFDILFGVIYALDDEVFYISDENYNFELRRNDIDKLYDFLVYCSQNDPKELKYEKKIKKVGRR